MEIQYRSIWSPGFTIENFIVLSLLGSRDRDEIVQGKKKKKHIHDLSTLVYLIRISCFYIHDVHVWRFVSFPCKNLKMVSLNSTDVLKVLCKIFMPTPIILLFIQSEYLRIISVPVVFRLKYWGVDKQKPTKIDIYFFN